MFKWLFDSLQGYNGVWSAIISGVTIAVLVIATALITAVIAVKIEDFLKKKNVKIKIPVGSVWRNPGMILLVNLVIILTPAVVTIILVAVSFGNLFHLGMRGVLLISIVPIFFFYANAIRAFAKTPYFRIFAYVDINTMAIYEDQFLKFMFSGNQNLFIRVLGTGNSLVYPWEKPIMSADTKVQSVRFGKGKEYNLSSGESVTFDCSMDVQLETTDEALKRHLVLSKGVLDTYLSNIAALYLNIFAQMYSDFGTLESELKELSKGFTSWLLLMQVQPEFDWTRYGIKRPTLVVNDADLSAIRQRLDNATQAYKDVVADVRRTYGQGINEETIARIVEKIMAAGGYATQITLSGDGGKSGKTMLEVNPMIANK